MSPFLSFLLIPLKSFSQGQPVVQLEGISTVPVAVEFSSFPFKDVFLTWDKLLWFAKKERTEGGKEGKESRRRRTKKK